MAITSKTLQVSEEQFFTIGASTECSKLTTSSNPFADGQIIEIDPQNCFGLSEWHYKKNATDKADTKSGYNQVLIIKDFPSPLYFSAVAKSKIGYADLNSDTLETLHNPDEGLYHIIKDKSFIDETTGEEIKKFFADNVCKIKLLTFYSKTTSGSYIERTITNIIGTPKPQQTAPQTAPF